MILPLLFGSSAALAIFLLLFLIALGFYIYYKFDYLAATALLAFLFFFLQVVDFGYQHVLQAHQKTRVDVLLGKTQDIKGVGYNINQSKIAIGSGIFLAERQKSSFNMLFIYGAVGIFFFHFLVNVGMTIGLFPIIGIPLPFVSYGGSSLLAFSILIFLVLRFDIVSY